MNKVFRTIIVLAVLLRLYFALSRNDLVWPDEHFQTLEPAGRVIWGVGFQAWEWIRGFRSWLGPLPYIPLFFVLKILGFKGGAVAIYSARVYLALISGVAIFFLDRFLEQRKFSNFSHFTALCFFAFHPAYILWGVTTLSDHLALDVLAIIFPFLYARPASFRSGVLLGILFLTRFQTIAWLPGYALYLLLFEKLTPRTVLETAMGYSLCVLLFGLVDWMTWGMPFKSIFNQLTQGLQISEGYGKHPFTQYFQFLYDNLGSLSAYGILVALVACWIKPQFRKLSFFVFLPSLSFFLVHSCLGHKEARFILPLYFSFSILIAIAVENLSTFIKTQVEAIPTALYGTAVLFLASGGFSVARGTALYLTPVNIFDLESKIHQDGMLFSPQSDKCILTVGHNWSWGRGHLMQGISFDFNEIELSEILRRTPSRCPYAIVHESKTTLFIRQSPEKWEFMAHAQDSPFALYRQTMR